MISNSKKSSIASIVLKLIYFSNIRFINGRSYFESEIKNGNSVLLCVWHSHLLNIVYDLRGLSFNALAGTHNDAEIISQVAAILPTSRRDVQTSGSETKMENFTPCTH